MSTTCEPIEPGILSRVCDVVESSEAMRFVAPHDRARVAEIVEEAGDGRELIENAAGLIVITGEDEEALQRLLLTLQSLGIPYAFANEACRVEAARRELWKLVRSPRPPLLLLRLGYAGSAS